MRMNSFFYSKFADDISGLIEWRTTLGFSKNDYFYEFKKFDKFCLSNYPEADTITKELASEYLESRRDYCDVRLDVIALRRLAEFQIMNGKTAYVFPADFYSYKKRKFPHIMTDGECERFFRATDNYPYDPHNPLVTYTAAVIFRLMFAAGLRPREARVLTRSDFDFRNNTIYITESKNHKDRRIALKPELMDMCKRYDKISRSYYPDTNIFFPNRNQHFHSAAFLQTVFKKCWRNAGNPDNLEYCSPYILRHNFATQTLMRWIEEGKQIDNYIPYLSAYMGHQTFRETYYYIHLLPERLSKLQYMGISDIIPEVCREE